MVIEREDSPADLCEDDGNGGEGFEERFGGFDGGFCDYGSVVSDFVEVKVG